MTDAALSGFGVVRTPGLTPAANNTVVANISGATAYPTNVLISSIPFEAADVTVGSTTITGGTTTFNAVTAVGGSGGVGPTGGVTTTGLGGIGGTGGTGTAVRARGNPGGLNVYTSGTPAQLWGGLGGSSAFFGGAGQSGTPDGGTGGAGGANTGGGGGGASGTFGVSYGGAGGGGSESVEVIFAAPGSTYAYSLGAGGAGGVGTGTGACTGGAGGTGYIVVEEHYNF